MAKIRKIYFFDKPKLKKMVSFLGEDTTDLFTNVLGNDAFGLLHYALPLRFKFLTESFVLKQDGEILGMISVSPVRGNPFKLEITRLFFDQNNYDAGKQLVNYVVAKYGAKGATSFCVAADESHEELLKLFCEGCSFRHCSNELLFKAVSKDFSCSCREFFRPFKNSDAQNVANLFNESLISHFKPSLSRVKNEFNEEISSSLFGKTKFRYVMEDKASETLLAYFSLTTFDDMNYVLDLCTSAWYNPSYDNIFNFVIRELSRRRKDFFLFVKSKKYTQNGEDFERYLNEKNFKWIQTKVILVKDFYRLVKEETPSKKVVLLKEATKAF